TAGFQCRVPVQAPFLTVELRGRAEARARGAPGRLGEPVEFHVQHDRLGDAANRQVAVQFTRGFAGLFRAGALEGRDRVTFAVKDICRAQVAVALFVTGVDARGLDFDFYR